MALVYDGDARAFEVIFDRHAGPAFALAYRMCGRRRERTEDEVERRDDARLVRSALDDLPRDQRQVIELAYHGGLSHAQIAATLGLPAGTVKGRMRLGLSKLHLALGEPAGVMP
jgi:RNA polymerase sigma factor (sigma-70 family)